MRYFKNKYNSQVAALSDPRLITEFTLVVKDNDGNVIQASPWIEIDKKEYDTLVPNIHK